MTEQDSPKPVDVEPDRFGEGGKEVALRAGDPPGAPPSILVGFLGLTVAGAHGVTQAQAPCTLNRNLVVVDLDDVKHRHIIDHALDARRAGKPRILHIRRDEATANRRASLRGIPTKPGYDRDEYPPAMSDEGGKGADVRYVLSAENRSAGSVMRFQLAPYCNEQRFIFERWRNR